MRMKQVGACLALAVVTVTADMSSAEAGRNHGGRAYYEDGVVVTAYSRHGNGVAEGPIRRGRHAWEVRLPGGTWVSCRRSCEETLRVETVDIFETDGRMTGYGAFQNQCGVLGCLELRLPR